MSDFESITELKTLRDFIRWGASEMYRHDLFFGHGFSSALDEAVYSCLFALKLPHNWPSSYFDTQLVESERKAVYELLSLRVKSRLPISYLTNEAWFCGLKFYVDERVLVPRSPIGELIQQQFEPWVDPESVHSILDLCTGSGCIAIASQYAFPSAHVCASDISKDALEVARKNRLAHGLEDDLELYESDCFNNIPAQQFDLIVSNPPYVDADDLSTMPTEFSQEPELGLAAGNDGLDIALKILSDAGDYLSNHGVLIVEVGNSAEALMDLLPDVAFSWIEFEQGGDGVFYISAEDLKIAKSDIDSIIKQR
ncbi:MAG: 50S ribosomal protein L3 N(5)-glutamine methyltransferase [Gammaproteobacteria bacterium]|nr:50S ribosomal protein L3 N(5)-glutamine methyltransferase [Gammaproteobacteria bacterium]